MAEQIICYLCISCKKRVDRQRKIRKMKDKNEVIKNSREGRYKKIQKKIGDLR
jgi:hypothetical protein